MPRRRRSPADRHFAFALAALAVWFCIIVAVVGLHVAR
jgi:hypothetical protein